jgi:hypothetical protein
MGRYVANVARHAAVVDALTESELSLALAAAANIVDLPVDDSRLDPAELALITRRLAKAFDGRPEPAAEPRREPQSTGEPELRRRKP